MSVRDEVRQALDLHKQGKSSTALTILKYLSKQHPDEELVWQGLATVTTSRVEKLYAVEQVLRVNPNNQRALDYRDKLHAKLTAVTEARVNAEPLDPVIPSDPPESKPEVRPQVITEIDEPPVIDPVMSLPLVQGAAAEKPVEPRPAFVYAPEAPTVTDVPIYTPPAKPAETPRPATQPTPITQPTPHYRPEHTPHQVVNTPSYWKPTTVNVAPKTMRARGMALFGSVLILVGLMLPFADFKFTYVEYSSWTGTWQSQYDFYEELNGVQGWGSQISVVPNSAIYHGTDYYGYSYIAGIADYAKTDMLEKGLPFVVPIYGVPILLTLFLKRRFATYRKIQAVGAVILGVALVGLFVTDLVDSAGVGMGVYAAGLVCWLVAGVIRLPASAQQPIARAMNVPNLQSSVGYGGMDLQQVVDSMTNPLHGWQVVSNDGTSVIVQKTVGISRWGGYLTMFLLSIIGVIVVLVGIALSRRRYVLYQPQVNGPVVAYDDRKHVFELRGIQDLHEFYEVNRGRLTYLEALVIGVFAVIANILFALAIG